MAEDAGRTRRRPSSLRWIVFGSLLFATLFWAHQGLRLTRTLDRPEDPTQAWARETLERYRTEDPQIAALVERARRDTRQLAILRAMEAAEGRSALKKAAEGKTVPGDRGTGLIVRLSLDPDLMPGPEARQALPYGYGGAFALLEREGNDAAVAEISESLARHARSDTWADVRDDPTALAVWEAVDDPALRRYYLENSDWLAEVLVQLLPGPDETDPERDPRDTIREAVLAARTFDPLPRLAYTEHGGAPAFLLFLPGSGSPGLGPLIAALAAREVPLADALEVSAANAHFLLERVGRRGPAAAAAELAELHATRRWIWDLAKAHPLALEADLTLPEVGARLLANKKYLDEGVLDFLFTWYEDDRNGKVLYNAALALDRYGDLALFELNRHKEDPRLLKLLSTQDFRVVAYAAMRGDAGLDDAAANPRWVDKYFEPGGTPRKPSWWADIPIVGGPAKLLSELAQGHPVTMGELGWAGLDLLDGALLVASFGTTAELTALKAAAKGGTKQAFRAAARKAVPHGVRRAGGSFLQRLAARVEARAFVRLFAWSAHALRWTGGAAVRSVKAIVAGYRSMPERLRRWIARGLLMATLFESLRHRTWPLLKRLARELPESAARETGEFLENAVKGAAAAVDDLLGRVTGATGALRSNALYLSMLVLFGLAALRAMPRPARAA